MKNLVLFFFIVSTLPVLFSCSNEHAQTIVEAECLISSNPDSAFVLLGNINNPQNLSEEQYALFLLLSTKARDKANLNISSDTLLYKAYGYFNKKKEYDKVAQAYFYENRVYQSRNCLEEAIKSCLLAKKHAEELQDFNLLGLIYHDLGYLYKEQLNFQETIHNFKKSLFYFQKAQNNDYTIYMYKRIGDAYLISRQLGYTDSASVNYQQALKYAEQENNQEEIYHTYKSISLNFCETEQLEEAKIYIKKAIEMSGKQPKDIDDYMSLSEIYLGLNNLDSALLCIKEAFSENTKLDLNENYIYKKMLYRVEREKKDYQSALTNLEECLTYKDSIYTNILSQSVLEIQRKYEKESLENEKNELLIERLYLFISCAFLFFLVFGASVFYTYVNRIQKKKLIKVQQTISSLEEVLQTKIIKENKFKELLAEKLDIAKKVTQMSIQPGNNSLFIKQYHKVFGHNITDMLNCDKLYPLINELYNDIIDKLKESHPRLSEKEIQFCCLIRAKFRQDQIAFILSYEYNSVRAIKMRLRTKMGFSNYDDFNRFLFAL